MKLVHGLGVVVAVAWMSGPMAARAQVPTQMPIQGFLTDAVGTPVNGATSIRFSLYDSDTAATALYTETQSVMVDQGSFAAYVGDVTALDLSIFASGSAQFVGITVGTDAEMTPRLALGTVPYAALAEYANSVPWANIAGVPPAISAFDPTGLQQRVAGTCPAGSSISAIGVDGTVTCEADDNTGTTYTPGFGLSLAGTAFAVNTTTVQARVTATCPAGQSIRAIDAAGAVTCEVDDSGSAYSAGTGLALVGTTFSISSGGVTSTQILDGTVATADIAANAIGTAQIADNSIRTTDLNTGYTANIASTTNVVVRPHYFNTLNGDTNVRVAISTGSNGYGDDPGGPGTVTVYADLGCSGTVLWTQALLGAGGYPWTYVSPQLTISDGSFMAVCVRASGATAPVRVRTLDLIY